MGLMYKNFLYSILEIYRKKNGLKNNNRYLIQKEKLYEKGRKRDKIEDKMINKERRLVGVGQ